MINMVFWFGTVNDGGLAFGAVYAYDHRQGHHIISLCIIGRASIFSKWPISEHKNVF